MPRTLALFMAPIFYYLCVILCINHIIVLPYPQYPISVIAFGLAISSLIYGISLDDD